MKVRVLAGEFLRFVPQQRIGAEHGTPVKLDETRLARGVDETERVNAEAFHGAQAARNRAVRHGPQHHVRRFGHERDEIPERIVRGAAGRHFIGRFRFDRVDEVRKLDGVLNEEDRHVVAHQVVIAFLRVELDGETAHVAHGIGRAARPLHRRKTHIDRCLHCGVLQECGLGVLAHRLVDLEHAMGGRTARMHDALGDAFVVEMRDLFTHDEIFEQRGAARTGAQRVLVIGDLHALIGPERFAIRPRAKLFEIFGFGIGARGGIACGLSGIRFTCHGKTPCVRRRQATRWPGARLTSSKRCSQGRGWFGTKGKS